MTFPIPLETTPFYLGHQDWAHRLCPAQLKDILHMGSGADGAPVCHAESIAKLTSHAPRAQCSDGSRAGRCRAGTPLGQDFDVISRSSSTITEVLKQDERSPSS